MTRPIISKAVDPLKCGLCGFPVPGKHWGYCDAGNRLQQDEPKPEPWPTAIARAAAKRERIRMATQEMLDLLTEMTPACICHVTEGRCWACRRKTLLDRIDGIAVPAPGGET